MTLYALNVLLLIRGDTKQIGVSRFVYIEMLDIYDNLILRRKVRRENGVFMATIPIDSLNVGNYFLRYYTQPIKYLDMEYIPVKQITVSKSERSPNNIIFEGEVLSNEKEYTVDFFVEGGNIVENIPQRVVFRCCDKYSLPVESHGVIVSSADTVKNEVRTGYNGYGEFVLSTQTGVKYCYIDSNGVKTDINLPKNGPAIRIVRLNNELRYKIDGADKTYTLNITAHGNPEFETEITPSRNYGVMNIADSTYGVLCFTLYDGEKAVSERLCYLDSDKSEELFNTDKTEYYVGESIKIMSDISIDGDYLVSIVKDTKILNPVQRRGIKANIMLQSDLKNLILNPDYIVKTENTEQFTDMILITEKWERYAKQIPDYRVGKEYYETISGKISGSRAVELSVYGSSMDELLILKPDRDGNFFAQLPDFVGETDFFIQPVSKNNKPIQLSNIQVLEDYYPELINPFKILSSINLKLDTTIIKSRDTTNSYRQTPISHYLESEKGMLVLNLSEVEVTGNRKQKEVQEEAKVFYGANIISEKDILRYSNFNIANAVGRLVGVMVKHYTPPPGSADPFPRYEVYSKRGVASLGALSQTGNAVDEISGYAYSEPLCPISIYVDGIITAPDIALNMSPTEIESIEKLTIAEASVFSGAKGFCGAINIKRKTNTYSPFEDDVYNTLSKGITLNKLGYIPNTGNPETDFFRSKTNIREGCTLKAPNQAGRYFLRVEGVTNEGNIVDVVKEIYVY